MWRVPDGLSMGVSSASELPCVVALQPLRAPPFAPTDEGGGDNRCSAVAALVQLDEPYAVLGQELNGRGEVRKGNLIFGALGGEFNRKRYGARLAQRSEVDALGVQVVDFACLISGVQGAGGAHVDPLDFSSSHQPPDLQPELGLEQIASAVQEAFPP